jgi:RecA-family ATPase
MELTEFDTIITPDAIMKEAEQLTAQQFDPQHDIYISAMDLLNREIENIPCLVEPFLQRVGLACIAGSSDTGKSSLLRYLCMCIVSGETDFLGFSIKAKHNRAILM